MTYGSFKRRFAPLLLGGVLAAASLTPAFAEPRWEHHGDWHGGHERHDWGRRDRWHGGGGGIGAGGVLLGLGIGAVAGAALAAPYYAAPPPPPPPVYYGY